MNHPTAAPRAGRRTRLAVTAGLAAALALGAPAAAQAEEALPTDGQAPQAAQAAQDQVAPPAGGVAEAAGTAEPAEATSAAEAAGPSEPDDTVDESGGPEAGVPAEETGAAGPSEPDGAVEPGEGTEPSEATETPDATAPAEEADPSADVTVGAAESVEGGATDAADTADVADGSATGLAESIDAAATLAADGSEGTADPAGVNGADAGLEQSETDGPELLQGEGFSYVVLTGEEGYRDWDDVFVEDKVTLYVGPGVYLWVDRGTASLTVPTEVDGVPVVGVKAEMCGLSYIDLSGCPELRFIAVTGNPVSEVDVSGCPKLAWADFSDTNIAALDVSNCPELEGLSCANTLLSRIDLSQNHSLFVADFQYARLEEIALPTPSNMTVVLSGNRLDEDAVAEITQWADAPGNNAYPLGLDNQEPPEAAGIQLLQGEGFSYAVLTGEEGLEEEALETFYAGDKSASYCGPGAYVWVDGDATSFVAPAQLDGAPVVGVVCTHGSLESLDLTAVAPTLRQLDCTGNSLAEVDVSQCASLSHLAVSENPLLALDLSGCPGLEVLSCSYVDITELDVTHNPLLRSLNVSNTPIRKLDISQNPLMERLTCENTDVEEIVLCDPAPGTMPVFYLDNNRLDDEELEKIAAWGEKHFDAIVFADSQRPPLTPEEPGGLELLQGEGFSYAVVPDEVEISEEDFKFHVGDKSAYYHGPGAYVWVDGDVTSFSAPAQLDGVPVVGVVCTHGSLESLDLTAAAPTLLYLECTGNSLAGIDVSQCSSLIYLDVSENPLAALDLSGCPSLEVLYCNHVDITEIDLSHNSLLWSLGVDTVPIRKLDISNNPQLKLLNCSNTEVEEIVLWDPAPGVMPIVFLENNRLDDEELAKIAAWEEEVGAVVLVGDQRPPLTPEEPGGLELLRGEGFSYAVVTDETELDNDGQKFYVGDKSSYYYGLGVYVWVDEGVTSFSVPAQLDGEPVAGVICSGGSLESLDLTAAAPTLLGLDCTGNNLAGIDLTGCTALFDLDVSENPLTSLDLSGCPNLEYLTCNDVDLTELDLSHSPLLTYLYLNNAPITELDLSHNPLLFSLFASNIPIRELDLSQNTNLYMFTCRYTDLEQIVLYGPAPGNRPIIFLENNRLDDEELAKIEAWGEEFDVMVSVGAGTQRPPLTPEEPTDPEEPGDPEDPSGPTDPEDPSEPDQPSDPTDPDEPGEPSDPDKPSEPQDPTGPEKPGAGQQGGSDTGKQPESSAGGIPQTGDASEGASQAAAALGALGAGAALAGAGLAALRRRA